MARGTAQIPDAPADQRLLDIAATHVRRFGAAHVAIVRIAAEAGMSHANVYRYFPSKDALIDEITAAWLKPLEAELRVIGDGPDPPADKLERLLFAVHRANGCFSPFIAPIAPSLTPTRSCSAFSSPPSRRTASSPASIAIACSRRCKGRWRTACRRAASPAPTCAAPAMALVFDMMHRFIHPASIRMDMDAPRVALETRASRVYAQLARALVAGRS